MPVPARLETFLIHRLRFPSSTLTPFCIVIIGKEAEPIYTNVTILFLTGLFWSAASLTFRLWFRHNKKTLCYSGDHISKVWLQTLISIGAGLLTVWLIQTFMSTVKPGWMNGLILIGIIPGFCFLLIPDKPRLKSHGPSVLEVFSNHFGLFHIRLNGQERLGQFWEGHTLGELDLRKKNLLVLAVIRGEEIIPFPKGPEMLRHDDDLLIFGSMNELGLTEMPK